MYTGKLQYRYIYNYEMSGSCITRSRVPQIFVAEANRRRGAALPTIAMAEADDGAAKALADSDIALVRKRMAERQAQKEAKAAAKAKAEADLVRARISADQERRKARAAAEQEAKAAAKAAEVELIRSKIAAVRHEQEQQVTKGDEAVKAAAARAAAAEAAAGEGAAAKPGGTEVAASLSEANAAVAESTRQEVKQLDAEHAEVEQINDALSFNKSRIKKDRLEAERSEAKAAAAMEAARVAAEEEKAAAEAEAARVAAEEQKAAAEAEAARVAEEEKPAAEAAEARAAPAEEKARAEAVRVAAAEQAAAEAEAARVAGMAEAKAALVEDVKDNEDAATEAEMTPVVTVLAKQADAESRVAEEPVIEAPGALVNTAAAAGLQVREQMEFRHLEAARLTAKHLAMEETKAEGPTVSASKAAEAEMAGVAKMKGKALLPMDATTPLRAWEATAVSTEDPPTTTKVPTITSPASASTQSGGSARTSRLPQRAIFATTASCNAIQLDGKRQGGGMPGSTSRPSKAMLRCPPALDPLSPPPPLPPPPACRLALQSEPSLLDVSASAGVAYLPGERGAADLCQSTSAPVLLSTTSLCSSDYILSGHASFQLPPPSMSPHLCHLQMRAQRLHQAALNAAEVAESARAQSNKSDPVSAARRLLVTQHEAQVTEVEAIKAAGQFSHSLKQHNRSGQTRRKFLRERERRDFLLRLPHSVTRHSGSVAPSPLRVPTAPFWSIS